MPSGFSDYLKDEVLDEAFGGVTFSAPASLYVGLSTTAINSDGSGIAEPDNGYARVEVANDKVTWGDASDGVVLNAIVIEFNEATGNWGEITHFFISDDLIGGNMFVYGALDISKTVQTGDTARFGIGDIEIILNGV